MISLFGYGLWFVKICHECPFICTEFLGPLRPPRPDKKHRGCGVLRGLQAPPRLVALRALFGAPLTAACLRGRLSLSFWLSTSQRTGCKPGFARTLTTEITETSFLLNDSHKRFLKRIDSNWVKHAGPCGIPFVVQLQPGIEIEMKSRFERQAV